MTTNAITGRVSVWVDKYCGIGPEQLINPPADIASRAAYFREAADVTGSGFTKIGYADVVLHLNSADEVINAEVASLRAQISQERAESEAKVTKLTRRLSELLALPMEVAA